MTEDRGRLKIDFSVPFGYIDRPAGALGSSHNVCRSPLHHPTFIYRPQTSHACMDCGA